MSCIIYYNKYDLSNVPRGSKKEFETHIGREVLNKALNDVYNIDLSEMEIAVHEHGKPYFKNRSDIHFNISHSGGYAAAALCDHPVGMDIQIVKNVTDRVIERVCSPDEKKYIESCIDRDHAFMRLWALKESYIKAIGSGMSYSMKKVNFRLGDCNAQTGRFSNKEGLYTLHDHGDHVLAACVLV